MENSYCREIVCEGRSIKIDEHKHSMNNLSHPVRTYKDKRCEIEMFCATSGVWGAIVNSQYDKQLHETWKSYKFVNAPPKFYLETTSTAEPHLHANLT